MGAQPSSCTETFAHLTAFVIVQSTQSYIPFYNVDIGKSPQIGVSAAFCGIEYWVELSIQSQGTYSSLLQDSKCLWVCSFTAINHSAGEEPHHWSPLLSSLDVGKQHIRWSHLSHSNFQPSAFSLLGSKSFRILSMLPSKRQTRNLIHRGARWSTRT